MPLVYVETNIINLNVCFYRKNNQRKERCYATGLDQNKVKFVIMTPVENCYVGYRCFEPKIKQHCQVNKANLILI